MSLAVSLTRAGGADADENTQVGDGRGEEEGHAVESAAGEVAQEDAVAGVDRLAGCLGIAVQFFSASFVCVC